MILHTLNALPSSDAFTDCLRSASENDAIILLGDGVHAALPGSAGMQALQECTAAVYMLESCANAAGISAGQSSIVSLSIDEFVSLTERFQRNLAWY